MKTFKTQVLIYSRKVVIPAKAGIQGFYNGLKFLDSRLRGNDGNRAPRVFADASGFDFIRPYPRPKKILFLEFDLGNSIKNKDAAISAPPAKAVAGSAPTPAGGR